MSLTFFHHILLLSVRLLTLKSLAFSPNRLVLSTNVFICSPRSNTRSIFSVIISLTPSISLCAVRIASFFPASVPPCSTIMRFNVPLKLAHPYGGKFAKSVSLTSNSAKNFFSRFVRKPNGMRWPRLLSAMTRNAMPPALAWLAGYSDGDFISVWM